MATESLAMGFQAPGSAGERGPELRVPGLESRVAGPESHAQSPEPRAPSPEPRVSGPESQAPSPEPRVSGPESQAPGPEPLLDAPWFAVWTRARAEKAVFDQLQRKDIESFLPTVRRVSRWKDRKKEIDWPLFPGYCFARFDVQNSLAVLKCVGVAQIIMADGKPAPIPHPEIAAIQRLVQSELKADPCPFIHEGDQVEVLRGPLAGVVGRLVRKGPHTQLVLSITMINRAVSVVFDAADVRKY